METFGYRLNRLIEKKEITQTDLANYLNIASSTVNRYVKDIRFPDQETLVKIADYFDVTTDYLLCRVDDPKNSIIYLPEDYEIEIKGDPKKINKEDLMNLIKKLEAVGFDVEKLLK